MAEQQTLEYKQSWHDDYLKWICGFAEWWCASYHVLLTYSFTHITFYEL